jgi:hypothetical protein
MLAQCETKHELSVLLLKLKSQHVLQQLLPASICSQMKFSSSSFSFLWENVNFKNIDKLTN